MVKGVNKTVIEVNCTDNGYFERAILFVNPEYSHLSSKRLYAEAERFVGTLELGGSVSKPEKKLRFFLSYKALIPITLAAGLFVAALLFFTKL